MLAAIARRASRRRDLDLIIHGTTATTNAVLERKLGAGRARSPRAASATRWNSAGARGRALRHDRHLRAADPARASPARSPSAWTRAARWSTPLDEAGVGAAARALLAAGCEALVIHFLHAYANPAHELARRRDRARASGRTATSRSATRCSRSTASTSAARRPRSTPPCSRSSTATSAACRPSSPRAGFARDLLVMNGNGGTVPARAGCARGGEDGDVRPGLGRHGGGGHAGRGGPRQRHHLRHGRHLHRRRADPRRRAGGLARTHHRLRPADPRADGRRAHGRRRRRLDRLASTRPACCGSGPRAAGSTPGPICYGRGGTRPTITDANLVLGRLDPARLLGGRGRPTSTACARAFARDDRRPARPVRRRRPPAAVIRLANTHMAGAIRMVSLSRGYDPRDFVLFAFGGAGPLHAVAIARELGIPRGAGARPAPASPTRSAASSPTCARTSCNTAQPAGSTTLDMDQVRRHPRRRSARAARAVNAAERDEIVETPGPARRRHAVPRPDPPDPRAAALRRRSTRETLQALFEAAYFARFQRAPAGDPRRCSSTSSPR